MTTFRNDPTHAPNSAKMRGISHGCCRAISHTIKSSCSDMGLSYHIHPSPEKHKTRLLRAYFDDDLITGVDNAAGCRPYGHGVKFRFVLCVE